MDNTTDLKTLVRDKYAEIAKGDKATIQASCCGATNSSQEVYNIMSDEYQMDGYKEEADLGLGFRFVIIPSREIFRGPVLY